MGAEQQGEGRIEAIWVKPAESSPMDPRDRVELVAGRGIAGNADQGGRRQVTLIDSRAWSAALADLGVEVPPSARRANFLVSGLELAESAGKTLRIGSTRVAVRGETLPCGLMDQQQPGLREALVPEWRGGIYGEVLDDGEVAVGDAVKWTDDAGDRSTE